MAFIAKNPLSVPVIKNTPSTPLGTRGLFAKEDGWYDIGADGKVKSLQFSENSVGEKTDDGGEIFNDYKGNKALGHYTKASGYNTIAGVTGYYFVRLDIDATNTTGTFYLSDTQTDTELALDEILSLSRDFAINYAVGDVVSYVSGSKFLDIGKITAIDTINKSVTVTATTEGTLKKGNYDTSVDDQIFYVFAKPTNGVANFGHYAVAEGEECVAIERSSHAEGRGTIGRGQYSHAEGRQTTAGYAAHSEGYKSKATANYAHAEGFETGASAPQAHAEGSYSKATADSAHAEGNNAKATAQAAHAEGIGSQANEQGSHSEGRATKANGIYAHAEGDSNEANGQATHAEGYRNIVDGLRAHGEGSENKVSGTSSHAEGRSNEVSGNYAHSEGGENKVSGEYSHGEGYQNEVNGAHAHVEGQEVKVYADYAHGEGQSNTISSEGKSSHVEGSNNTVEGVNAHAEGEYVVVKGAHAHGEGHVNTVTGMSSHVEGSNNEIVSNSSHAENSYNKVYADECHAEGRNNNIYVRCGHVEGALNVVRGSTPSNVAPNANHVEGKANETGINSYVCHVEGFKNLVDGQYVHVEGMQNTVASGVANAHVEGKGHNAYVDEVHIQGKFSLNDTEKKYLHITGNGKSDTKRSNAHTVDWDGNAWYSRNVTIVGTYNSAGADYAELFEWLDGNPDNEDRRGRFVTLDGEKIRFATPDDDYILGIISAAPCLVGDSFSDWQGKYLTDVFGKKLTQTVHYDAEYEEIESVVPETGEKTTEKVLVHDAYDAEEWILNPDYNADEEYIPRESRPEWAYVGFMGKLVVEDDGSCIVNGYCKVGENGIATNSTEKSGYRVMARLDDAHVKVLVR